MTKMLILEDEVMYSGLLRNYLSGLVDELIIVTTWDEADKYINGADIAWIDLIVPPYSEEQAYVKIGEVRRNNADMVIFVVSGVSRPDVEERSIAAGADIFAHKMSVVGQNQVLALMMQALLQVQKKGTDVIKHLNKARQLMTERINPEPQTT